MQNQTVKKKDVEPQVVWNKILTGNDYNKTALAITKTDDGGFVVGGGGDNVSYVVKLDSNGNKIWSKIFSGNKVFLGCRAITKTDDGGFVVAERENNDSYVMKLK